MTTGIIRGRSEKLGFPPGSLIFVGEQKTDTVVLTVSNYDEVRFEEKQAATIEDCLSYRDLPSTTWIHVCGLHRPDFIETLGKSYNIHHLFLEDILNTAQRPKMDDLEDGLFIVMKVLTIIATIFIPITFIAGVYGMNFEYMPELKWKLGYVLVWGVMIVMIVVMLSYFRKKKWL